MTSDAFAEGQPIPAAHAGKILGYRGLSPQLAWSAVPDGTVSVLPSWPAPAGRYWHAGGSRARTSA